MTAFCVIPARLGSTRLPEKPLLQQTGKYLVQHVYEQACQARRVEGAGIATDDLRVKQAVESFQGRVWLTRRDHLSGTDRIAEVAARWIQNDILVNVQGDEPELRPEAIDRVVELLEEDSGADMATLATPIRDRDQWQDPACVKVVFDQAGAALYFSRAPLPYARDRALRSISAELPYLMPATRSRISNRSPRSPTCTSGSTPTVTIFCSALPRCRRRDSSSWRSSNSCVPWRTVFELRWAWSTRRVSGSTHRKTTGGLSSVTGRGSAPRPRH